VTSDLTNARVTSRFPLLNPLSYRENRCNSTSKVGIMPLLACEVEYLGHAFQSHRQKIKRIQRVQILNNHTKNFGTVPYQLRLPSQFQKPAQQELCVVSTTVVRNNINLIREWSGQPEIVNLPTRGYAYHTVYN
jgi:hypothetical protein